MPRKTVKPAGTFHIVEMDQWDEDFLNLVTRAYMQLNADGTGRFQFGAVHGVMDCRWTERDGKPALDFSWEGFDEGDPVTGRGWALLDGDMLNGHLYFHMGDDSGFVAKRAKDAARKR